MTALLVLLLVAAPGPRFVGGAQGGHQVAEERPSPAAAGSQGAQAPAQGTAAPASAGPQGAQAPEARALAVPAETRALEEYVAPKYPPVALLRRLEGRVRCRLLVDEGGIVTSYDVDDASDPELYRAAIEVIPRLRFAFGPRKTQVAFSFTFKLEPEFGVVPGLLAVNGAVHLEVREAGTRTAVPGATIVAVGLGSGGLTDAHGKAELTLPAGEENLLVYTPEHAFAQVRVIVPAGKSASTTVYLYRTRPGEFSATVPGERRRDAPVQTELGREELRNIPGTNEDPLRVIELLPGVARAPFAGGQLLVRGARPEDTGAYINGQRIPILYHLLNGPSVLSESALDRLDFLPGGAGVFYGRNLAGIVSVTPRTNRPEDWHGVVAADLKKSSLFLEAPIADRSQFFAAGRVSYTNPIERYFSTDSDTTPKPTYGDYQVGYRQRLDGGHSVGLLAFGSEDAVSQSEAGRGLSIATQDQQIGFHRLQLLGNFAISPTTTLSVTPLFGYDHSLDRSTGTPGLANAPPQVQDTRTLAAGLRSELVYKPSTRLDVHAGLDFSLDDVRYRFDQEATQDLEQLGATSSERVIRDGRQDTAAFGEYAEASLDLGPLRVTPGLRLDLIHWNGHTRAGFDPRIWIRVPHAGGEAFAYAGLYHQAPQAIELDPSAGNPELGLEQALQTGIGAEQRWEGFSARIEGFYQRRSNLVFPATPRAGADGRIANPHFLNSGVGRSYGVEVLLRKQLTSSFYGWIAYTLSRSEEIPGPGDPWQPGAFDQTHILSIVGAMRISTQIELSTRLRVATGNPDRRILDAIFDSTSGRFVPVTQPLGSQRIPAFTQLDVEFNNIWTADLYRIALYVDLENLFNTRNGEVLVHDYRFQEQDVLPGPPFSAAVGARVTF